MKRIALVGILINLAVLAVLGLLPSQDGYVAGSIRIPARGIEASIYTREAEPIDGMSSLWQGGTVTTDADLSNVQVGDYAHIYTTEGEHLVLECVRIRKGLGWFEKPQGDVIVINQKWVYRFTRL